MRKGHAHTWLVVLIILFAGSSVVQRVNGQDNKPSEDRQAIQQLLAGVRMLRQALQTIHRMNLDTYQSQLLTDRIRVNREDVRRLTSKRPRLHSRVNAGQQP